jgi:hypothetical protein
MRSYLRGIATAPFILTGPATAAAVGAGDSLRPVSPGGGATGEESPAALPLVLCRLVPARLVFSVGETYDFEFTPRATGKYRLRVRTNFSSNPAAEAVAAVRVRH